MQNPKREKIFIKKKNQQISSESPSPPPSICAQIFAATKVLLLLL
jgi:hypothetical protein